MSDTQERLDEIAEAIAQIKSAAETASRAMGDDTQKDDLALNLLPDNLPRRQLGKDREGQEKVCKRDYIEKAVEDMRSMSIMGMLAASIFANRKREKKIDGIECPLCHKKNGRIQGVFLQHFMCPDCKAVISNHEIESDDDAFRKWFSQFNKKQD